MHSVWSSVRTFARKSVQIGKISRRESLVFILHLLLFDIGRWGGLRVDKPMLKVIDLAVLSRPLFYMLKTHLYELYISHGADLDLFPLLPLPPPSRKKKVGKLLPVICEALSGESLKEEAFSYCRQNWHLVYRVSMVEFLFHTEFSLMALMTQVLMGLLINLRGMSLLTQYPINVVQVNVDLLWQQKRIRSELTFQTEKKKVTSNTMD